jgi:hypothetical protein
MNEQTKFSRRDLRFAPAKQSLPATEGSDPAGIWAASNQPLHMFQGLGFANSALYKSNKYLVCML